MSNLLEIRPQPGPQLGFLSSPADIVIYGGSAGGGKSWAILLECLRNINNPNFAAVVFRRTYPQIKAPGGLWAASQGVYSLVGGVPKETALAWCFPSGASVVFRHLKLERNIYDWQGAEVPLFCFDELTHFTETQFWYMLSRNRSTCGVWPYIRATCNPDADSWVRGLISWWLDDEGYPNLDKSGVVRYFIRENDEVRWVDADWRDEMGIGPKSITFIPSSIYDNPALLQKDPGYLANLRSLPEVERGRLLGKKGVGGNWNIKISAGKVFRPEWFPIVDAAPPGETIRFWDFAGSLQQTRGHDPDWTAGVKMRLADDGDVYVLDVVAERLTPAGVDQLFQQTAYQDGHDCQVGWFQDPGQAGLYQSSKLRQLIKGLSGRGVVCSLNKYLRARALSRAAEFGEVKLVRGRWNQAFLNHMGAFPDGTHDDICDAASGAYNELTGLYSKRFKASQQRAA